MPLEPPILVALAALAVAAVAASLTVSRRRRSADAAKAYLKGFRYILSDEPDAALEELTRAANVDERTVETYYALGALFRRTGEHERAIRLHQNMLLREDLEPRHRHQAWLELALDYQRAGMLERAEVTYRKLLDEDASHVEGLTRLRQVCEERKDFPKAAEAQGRLVELKQGSRQILAHLLSEAALAEADAELAQGFARRALEIDGGSAHAALAGGIVRLRHGAPSEAARLLMRACELDPEVAVKAAEPFEQACAAAGLSAEAFYLERVERGFDHAAIRVALARCLRRSARIEDAIVCLRRALELDAHFVEARVELGKTLLESGMGGSVRGELEGLLAALGQKAPGFVCRGCGQGFSEALFRCPRCLAWDTIRRGAPPAGAPMSAAVPR